MAFLIRSAAVGALILACASASPIHAQHEGHGVSPGHEMMTGPLGLSMDRMGSGTTWIPDVVPLPSRHQNVGRWELMLHGFVFPDYVSTSGLRGANQFSVLNWGMIMASRKVPGGLLQFRTMLSVDPVTVPNGGYPLLLQVGETYRGVPLRDRQHPHDFWKELAVLYEGKLSDRLAVSLYAAPSGEPALGPVAFMHRPSAMDNPVAPLGHHWQDATHITYGVLTAGVFTRWAKLEGSVFNGREPDEERWTIDPIRFDSWSGRLTVNPTAKVSMTFGYGYLNSHERLHPGANTRRMTASLLTGRTLRDSGQWATSFVWGMNGHEGTWSHASLVETEAIIDRSNTVFGRAEIAERAADDLGIPELAGQSFVVSSVTAGYIRDFVRSFGVTTGLGVRATANSVPNALATFYGSRTPTALGVFLRVRPAYPQR
jgi:hypothetical protein